METNSSDKERQSSSEAKSEPLIDNDAVFTPAQMSAIQETVSTSVNEALRALNNHNAPSSFSDDLHTSIPCIPNTETAVGCKGKIPRGE